ncbi:MAG: GntG family PLP-dependent aldolase [Rhodothermales bacterium]
MMSAVVDLRSDTVTRPSEEMRRAMFEAVVGDDVFGEDPTAIALEEEVARILGKEAALFVTSGTMGNQIAIRLHTQPGDEVICEAGSHIAHYEAGAPAALSGVLLRSVEGHRGVITPVQIRGQARHGFDWEARTRLLSLENTHNRAGGAVFPLRQLQEACAAGRELGLALHLDGARLWNASAATGIAEARFAEPFDTVSVCLSKGLGAPVGSVLAGSAETIRRARRIRKMLGGGMRQIGMLAAAGLYALEHHRASLLDDHAKARKLADTIAALPKLEIDEPGAETNIVMFNVKEETANDALDALTKRGVLMVPFGPTTIRASAHRDVSHDDIDRVIDILKELFG